jgi:hypothetical protein
VPPWPWLIVTTGWPVMTAAAGRALAGSGTRLLALAVVGAVAVAVVIVGSLVFLRHRSRTEAEPRPSS